MAETTRTLPLDQSRRGPVQPSTLEEEVPYVSDEFYAAAHICACGFGSKIRTPLGPEKWSVKETRTGPTVRPSVGNWQKACRSHYFITGGEVEWLRAWSEDELPAELTSSPD